MDEEDEEEELSLGCGDVETGGETAVDAGI
jgi:hypothetical protein